MIVFQKIQHYFSEQLFPVQSEPSPVAYDAWSKEYDNQRDNLMLALDEEVFTSLLSDLNINNAIIADVGCGTGRHWKKILDKEPQKLIGFDVSKGMLKMLQQKYPTAETYLLLNDDLKQLANESCDVIISTLTIAHIKNADTAIAEWARILKPGGHIILTDYHPFILAKGGKRTFRHNNKTMAVINYVHSIESIKRITKQLDMQQLKLIEKIIDDNAKPYYVKHHTLDVFEKWKGSPIIYGMCIKKPDAAL